MRNQTMLAFMFAAIATPSLAENQCEQVFSRVDDFAKQVGVEIATDGLAVETDDGCMVRGVDIRIRKGLSVTAREISWTGVELERFAEHGLFPDKADIEVAGMRTETTGANPFLQSIAGGRVRPPANVDVSWLWVQNAGVMRLTTKEGGRDADPSVWIDAEIDGLNLSSPARAVASLATMSFHQANTRLHLGRSIERLVLLAAAADAVDGSDSATIPEVRTKMLEAIDTIPDTLVPTSSRAALASAARTWPHTVGTLSVEVAPTSGFGVSNLLPMLVSDTGADALSGLSVDIQYDR